MLYTRMSKCVVINLSTELRQQISKHRPSHPAAQAETYDTIDMQNMAAPAYQTLG